MHTGIPRNPKPHPCARSSTCWRSTRPARCLSKLHAGITPVDMISASKSANSYAPSITSIQLGGDHIGEMISNRTKEALTLLASMTKPDA
jgi:hypothetical protein